LQISGKCNFIAKPFPADGLATKGEQKTGILDSFMTIGKHFTFGGGAMNE
jgi:hypothetical protein